MRPLDRSFSQLISLRTSIAFGLAIAVASQAIAKPSPSLGVNHHAVPASSGSSPYVPIPRMVTFGEGAAGQFSTDSIATVTFNRAADLVGRPLAMVRAYSPALRAQYGTASLGASSLSSGALPSSVPVTSSFLTSGFGMREHPILGGWRTHTGIDLAAPIGAPIRATSDGQVSRADWFGGYGLFVSLEHGGGVETRYGHMSRLNVLAGQQVRKGDVIGFVGSTGRSTGPHLHYEIRLDGRAINPASAIRDR
jgi:murein DD-endopeptidase MepM/ murein hydrolase activator NlpD